MPIGTMTISDSQGLPSVVLKVELETDSPAASMAGQDWERAIVIHAIPASGEDIGQDMGSFSRKHNFDGICQTDVRDKLEAMIGADQFGALFPSGRFTVTITNDSGATVFSKTPCAMKAFGWRFMPGTDGKWLRYNLQMIEFHQT